MPNEITDVEQYNKDVVYYFDTDLNARILNLSIEDKARLFKCLSENADIFIKLFHKGVDILEYIQYGDPCYSAKKYPHDGIDLDYECPIVKEYKVWQLLQKR